MTVNYKEVAKMILDESVLVSVKEEIINKLEPMDAIRVGMAIADVSLDSSREVA